MIDFVRPSRGEQLRILCSTVLMILIPVALRLWSFSTVRVVLVRAASRYRAIVAGEPSAGRVVHAVEVTDAHVPGSRTCLVRSLTSETLLRLYGYTPTHRIGVDPQNDDGFVAHSWLEHDGDILIGDLDDMARYEALPPLERLDDP